MSMRDGLRCSRSTAHSRISSVLMRVALVSLLGVGTALLVSCASSGKGLIPSGNAGPLQSDFEAVAQAAQNGNGHCATTEAAIAKTETDFGALPATVDQGLRSRLREGITNLRTHALGACAEPLPQATVTTTAPRTTSTQTTATTPTVTQTTPTQTTPTTSTPTTSVPGGGTPAPGEEGAGEAAGKGRGGGAGQGGAGGAEPGAGAGGEGNGHGQGNGK
jgi:hypothetical protein